jgi:hypothetical protein
MKTTLLILALTISIFGGNDSVQQQLNQVNKNFFIENKGQWPSEVKYLAKVGGMNAWITNSGVVYDYYQRNRNYYETETLKMCPDKKKEFEKRNVIIKGHIISMQFADVNKASTQQGNDKQEGYYNYFIGNDKSKWAPNVILYGDVEQDDIYNSINVKYYFDGNSIRYDYLLKPGADLSKLRLKFEGQELIWVNDSGELVIKTSVGEVTNGKLYSYQIDNGNQKEVNCRFVQNSDGTISFKATTYDRTKELIIDPLIYSTFIGKSNGNLSHSIVVDNDGNAYITGYTESSIYPTTPGAYQTSWAANDAFVTKLNSIGSALVYSTFIGGSHYEQGNSIAIDASRNAYITGFTESSDFPTTPGAYQSTFGGAAHDVFVTKLNASGTALVYSTFLGGNSNEDGSSIATDISGNAFITGWTGSTNFPTTSGAFQTHYGGSSVFDAFVTKLNPSGSALVYSTFLGGYNTAYDGDYGFAIAIDGGGNAYITGQTASSNFPTTPGAYQRTRNSSTDCFVSKLNPTGSALVYSTFLGGNGIGLGDHGTSLVIDASGNTFIIGRTGSTNFPTTPGAYQTNYGGGGYDVFVTKLNSTGSSLIYSTFIGGNGDEFGNSIAIDASGKAYIVTQTTSSNYPTTPGAFQTTYGGGSSHYNGDATVSELSPDGSDLVYSTFLGGNSEEYGSSIALDVSNNTIITGWTYSTNYPTTPGVYQTSLGGYADVFVTKLNLQPIGKNKTPVSGQNNNLSFGSTNILLDILVSIPNQISTIYYEYESPKSGALPSGINRVSQYYWSISTSGTISFINGYVKVPVSSLRGVNNPSNLVWLFRANAGDPWTNIGGTVNTNGNLENTTPFTSLGEFAIGTIGDDQLPIELSSLTTVTKGRSIQLNWETKTEKNSDEFVIERKTSVTFWKKIGSVKASVLSNSPKQYSYTDKNLQSGIYQYRLMMIDNDGTFEYSKIIENEIAVPKNFELSQNYPNPFNPSTKINYNLHSDSKVTLDVYNITGAQISQLVNEDQSAGYYSIDFNSSSINSSISSGVYFYRITAVNKTTGNNFSAIKKMVLLK